jgi:hypothetical protein
MNTNDAQLKDVVWKDFKITDIFVIEKGERLTEVNRISGEIPLITASAYNNGITCLIDKDSFKDKKALFNNKITIDMLFTGKDIISLFNLCSLTCLPNPYLCAIFFKIVTKNIQI